MRLRTLCGSLLLRFTARAGAKGEGTFFSAWGILQVIVTSATGLARELLVYGILIILS